MSVIKTQTAQKALDSVGSGRPVSYKRVPMMRKLNFPCFYVCLTYLTLVVRASDSCCQSRSSILIKLPEELL